MGDESVQVPCPARAFEQVSPSEFHGDADDVRRLTPTVDVDGDIEDHAMGGPVEVPAAVRELPPRRPPAPGFNIITPRTAFSASML
jgi:hypothetical protein